MDNAGQEDASGHSPSEVTANTGDAAVEPKLQGHGSKVDSSFQLQPIEPPKNFGVTTPSNKGGHTCGTGCGHDHSHSQQHTHTHNASSGGGHYYAETQPVRPQQLELPKSKSKAGWWALGIIAAAGVGAYLINSDKARKKASVPKPADWKERTDQSTTAESRGL